MIEWLYPETWQAGDKLDEDTLNRRIRDQMTILLRRPILVAHNSSDQTVPTTTDYNISLNTIDQDDDGMCVTGTPALSFTVQRAGTYQVWLDTTFHGNGSVSTVLQTSVWIGSGSGKRRWDIQTRGVTTSGAICCRSNNGLLILSAGDKVIPRCYQNTGSNMTLKATMNTPRLVIMWLGVS